MIVPNKVISFSESIIAKMPIILKSLSREEMTLKELFFTTQDYFEIAEFIYALDVLYLLEAIKVDTDKGVIIYVNKD
ncbi:ABC-three component system middle component 7 [Bacillus safensis]|uniref:ABC-three component system middle component 7 n=1 Tax=Bacillus safensis TaxID=561879 RepID=UPI00201D7F6F|nr:ABC-three component system middle component 7 [Bacillus safensis]UQZ92132.1 hypothetical protein EI692_03750 [Bacillus safensis]